MSKKGGSSAPQTSNVYQSNLPQYARPYYEHMMQAAEIQANQPYVGYGGPRIAGFSPDQQSAFTGIQNLAQQGNPTLDQAVNYTQQAGMAGMQAGQHAPVFTQTGDWAHADVGSYMNPYLSNVLDVMRNQAQQGFQEQQLARDTQAQKAGAYGGSRQAISDMVAQRDLNANLANMNAQQLAQAYQSGLGAYQSDQSRNLQSQMGNQATDMQAANLRMQGAQLGLGAAGQMGQMGQAQQQLMLDRLAALQKAGTLQQGQAQSAMDVAYQDFVNQQNYPRQNLEFMSGIMHGVPVSANQSVLGYQAPPNPVSQMLGMGIAAQGLSQLTSPGTAPAGGTP